MKKKYQTKPKDKEHRRNKQSVQKEEYKQSVFNQSLYEDDTSICHCPLDFVCKNCKGIIDGCYCGVKEICLCPRGYF